MCIQYQIKDLTTFMQTEVYASLDESTKTALVRKKVELCEKYFLNIAASLNRNKFHGCYAPHKAVMIMAVMELVESGYITTNVIRYDKKLKDKFKEIWQEVVPIGSPFNCDSRTPFTHMAGEPFWKLSDDKGEACITSEAFCAFSHGKSRMAIKACLLRSIKDDTISEQYGGEHPGINWMVAEDVLGILPLVGFMIAV